MSISKPARFITSIAVLSLTVLASVADASNYNRKYQVTVTNITPAIAFTPILAATHNSSVALFQLGSMASDELGALAEGGATDPLEGELSGAHGVAETTTTSGLLMGGETVEFEISTSRRMGKFSMAAMLLPTNDAFVALDGVRLPNRGRKTYYAHAYDAGSEINDQLCANIPGPQCGGAGDGSFTAVDGEGFVHMSNGIHEQGDIPGGSARYDWRGAVAEITIRRIR
ncbi:hypothetical protein AB833_13150 [Chromatiales bacterium (ex Bugula neritina AB1)]|nr:hypothetical protein AB833_13150 [Chromatiales bacterium (ex Bugula neritina AB1)]